MSRKATITQKEIVNAAFKITKKEGFEQITSRKLAAAAGCSTQPIFRIYENMDGLKKDVYEKAADYYEDYYTFIDVIYEDAGSLSSSGLWVYMYHRGFVDSYSKYYSNNIDMC